MKGKNTKDKLIPEGFIRNKALDKYSNKVLFKEKVKMANHILKTVGIPNISE